MAEGGEDIRMAHRHDEASMPSTSGEAAGAVGGRGYGIAKRMRLFSEEEYVKCQNIKGPNFRGFSFMSVEKLFSVSGEWQDKNLQSKNPYFLRGLAVTYFYQSQMSKAHELLLEIGALQKELLDIDLALMLAECACALPDTDDEFEKALERVRHLVSGERALTYQLIDDWDAKLKKNGRFMGYIILQYALHASRFRCVSSESEIAKRLILAFIKNVLKRLHEVSDDVKEKPHEHLIAAIQTFIKTLVQCCERLTPDRSMHAYVEALCYNCNAWSLLCEGKYKTALDSVNRGLHIMEAGGYRGDPNERALYGDLHFNKGAALDRLERHEEAQNEFDKAAVIYETLVKDHPDEISKGKVAAVATECSINARLGGSRL